MGMASMPDGKTLIEIYRRMARIQRNDERFRAALRIGQFATVYYPPRGQEVIPAATSVNLHNDDYIVTTYRGLHDQIAKGVPLPELWAEYFGKATGSCKGKGGPMHITYPKMGVMVTTGIVGSGIPIANGLALASQLQHTGRVVVCYFGDGACNIGAFHEGLNLASLWKLPVVFVCQNNRYAEHTAYDLGTSVPHIALRASGYSMPGVTVDGNDPTAVWQASLEAINRARRAEGPTLLEAVTFRFHGHVFGDESKYIPKEEMSDALQRDPVPRMRATLIATGVVSDSGLKDIEAHIDREIDNAVEFASNSPYTDPKELRRDVYAEGVLT